MANNSEVSFTVKVKDAATAALKQIEGGVSGTVSKLLSLKGAFAALGGALAGVSIGVIAKDIIELGIASDKAFRQMAANLPTGIEGIKELKSQMNDLAISTGHSLEEVHAAGIEIAKLGVSGPGEVMERLNAAMLVADATGTDLTATIQGLDQIMDTFGLSSGQATGTLAKLVSAAKGRVDIQSLFDGFAKAAPAVQKLGVDVETFTKALVVMLDRGYNTKRALSYLESIDAAGIRSVAKDAHVADTAMADLQKSADIVRESTANMSQGLRTQFATILEDLGTNILPAVNGALEIMNFWLESISHHVSKVDLKAFIAQAKEAGQLSMGGKTPFASPAFALSSLNTAVQKGQFDSAQISAQEAEQIRQAIEVSVRMAQEAWAKNHRGNQMAVQDVQSLRDQYKSLLAVLDAVQSKPGVPAGVGGKGGPLPKTVEEQKKEADAAEKFAEIVRKFTVARGQLAAAAQTSAKELLDEIAGSLTDLRGDLLKKQLATIHEQNDALRAQAVANTALAKTDRDRLLAEIDIREAMQKQQAINDDLIAKAELTSAGVGGVGASGFANAAAEDVLHLVERTRELNDAREKTVKLGGDTAKVDAEIAKLAREIAKLRGDEAGAAAGTLQTDDQRLQKLHDQAYAIERGARAALQLAEAFGVVDERTAQALESVAQIAANIPGALSGDLGSVLSVAGGVASIVSNFLGASKAQEEAAERLREAAAAFGGKVGTFWSDAFNANNPLAAALGGVTDQVNAMLLELEKFRGSMNTDTFNQTGSVIKSAGDLKTSKIIADFWDSITEALNGLDGPAGAYRNALNAIEKEYAEQQAAVLTLGNNEDDLAKIRALHQQKLDALNAAEAARVQQIDDSLELRRLEALGLDDEATALRRQLEESGQLHEAELQGYSDAQIEKLKYVQALEDEAIAQKKAADAARAAAHAYEEAMDQSDRILGKSPAERAKERAAYYGIDLGDVSTEAGRDAVVNALRVMFQNDPGNKALADHIDSLISILESITFASAGGVSGGSAVAAGKAATSSLSLGYQSLTSGQGSILADLERQQVIYLKNIDLTLSSAFGRGLLQVGNQTGFVATGFAPIRVQIGPNHFYGVGGDARAIADELGTRAARRISEQLGRDVLRQKLRNGDVSVSS